MSSTTARRLWRRLFSPWKGHHVVQGDLHVRASATGAVPAVPGAEPFPIPWGFVSQEKILESVVPDRAAGGGGNDTRIVEKRAEHLNLDSWEFLRGVEQAYRYTADLFARQQEQQQQQEQHQEQQQEQQQERYGPPPCARAPAHGSAIDDGSAGGGRNGAGGGGASPGTAAVGEAGAGGEELAAPSSGRPPQQAAEVVGTDFFDFDVASPQMSMFLNDVLESYRIQGLVPRLSVTSVEARLCKVGVRLGGISKNTNFMGMMSADEARYHLTMGMLGPEGMVINELEGRAPQRVIADVELTCEEEFVLEDGEGTVVHSPESSGPKVHYLTLQSNIGEGTDLEWQITNINDVIKPTFSYYFSRFGH